MTLPAWRPLRWALIGAVAAIALLNASLVLGTIRYMASGGGGEDFGTFLRVAGLANPFDYGGWRWSPVAAWGMPALIGLGLPVLTALKFGVLPLFGWRGLLIGTSWPFWFDVAAGNILTFVLVVAWFAWRGNRVAMVAFLILTLLMPRPIMLPLAAWLLWKEPWTRLPFGALFTVHAGLVLVSGYGGDWIGRLLAISGELTHQANVGPSHWIGVAWVPIGIALAVWLTRRGKIGLASLAASPYLFPYYLLFGALELAPHPLRDDADLAEAVRQHLHAVPAAGLGPEAEGQRPT